MTVGRPDADRHDVGTDRRPSPAQPSPGRRGLVVAMVLAALAATVGAGLGVPTRSTAGAVTTADEPQYLLTALSLAEDGELDIADELGDERWRAFHAVDLPQQTRPLPDGTRVSPHDPLLPVLLAPAVGLIGWRGGPWTLVAVASALAAMLTWTAVRRLGVRPRVAGVVVGVLGASAPLAPYGSEVYPELPAALVVATALAALLRAQPRARELVVAGMAVVALPWLAVKYVPVALVLTLGLVVPLRHRGRRTQLVVVLAVLAAAGAAYLAVHRAIWTGWTVYASGDHFVDSGQLGVVGLSPDYLARSVRLTALLVERRFGIATWQPAWLLLLPALGAAVRRRPHGTGLLLGVLLAGWLTATYAALTMAGWWFPGRQVVVVLPAAVLVLARWVDGSRRRELAAALLGLLGVIAWAWVAVEAATGRLTLVVDFDRTTYPLVQVWARVLPDFQHLTTTTWWLHGAWVVVVMALTTWGWRHARTTDVPARARPPSPRHGSVAP